MTQYLQSVLGFSTVKAGAVLIPQAVTMMILAPMSPIWVRRFGNKKVVAAGLATVALSFVLFTTFQATSSTIHIIFVMCVMAVGMSHVMAPCTDSIMGSLPKAKAGVGSAVNDTTRQMGGAVGVAVFGSLMASHFTNSMTSKLSSTLPPDLFERVKDNVASALGIATRIPEAQQFRSQIVSAANESFVSGLHIIGLIAAFITLLAAVGVLIFLPARARDEVDIVSTASDLEPMPVGAAG
jgi:Na+/melibiose symporter-like transporter